MTNPDNPTVTEEAFINDLVEWLTPFEITFTDDGKESICEIVRRHFPAEPQNATKAALYQHHQWAIETMGKRYSDLPLYKESETALAGWIPGSPNNTVSEPQKCGVSEEVIERIVKRFFFDGSHPRGPRGALRDILRSELSVQTDAYRDLVADRDSWCQQAEMHVQTAVECLQEIKQLKAQLSAQESAWRPISGGVPEQKPVIAYFEKSGGMCAGQFYNGAFLSRPGCYNMSPSHWMPLPEPPPTQQGR